MGDEMKKKSRRHVFLALRFNLNTLKNHMSAFLLYVFLSYVWLNLENEQNGLEQTAMITLKQNVDPAELKHTWKIFRRWYFVSLSYHTIYSKKSLIWMLFNSNLDSFAEIHLMNFTKKIDFCWVKIVVWNLNSFAENHLKLLFWEICYLFNAKNAVQNR